MVHLLKTTLIRVGNDDYAKQQHLRLDDPEEPSCRGGRKRGAFPLYRQSGKQWSLLTKRAIVRNVTSTNVNNYLKEITGNDITAKDFRAWAGTVLAAMALNELESFDSAAQAKRNLRAAIEKVAGKLGDTPTICRKC